uniref:Uncharacterized protein n=1 Tax=Tetraodon nigroviridis TaxID=99883 RepID=H3CQC4_TETNG
MILTGHTLCLPSPATVQELFSVARDASILPEISLDPVLTTFLSLIFDLVSQQVRGAERADPEARRSQAQQVLGINSVSRIGSIIHRYLQFVPGLANDEENMAETTEIFDELLNLELLDHYERMTTKKRMSTEAMQQWLTGAAFHLHIRIHQVRLNSVPVGAAESLRRSYKSELNQLIEHYKVYLRRNVQVTAPPGPGKHKSRQSSVLKQTNPFNQTSLTCSGTAPIPVSTTTGKNNETNASGAKALEVLDQVSGQNVTNMKNRGSVGTEKKKKLSSSAGISCGGLGLLVIEPLRNVSHSVQYHQCQSPAIQQALVTRIMDALDMEQNKHFFQYTGTVFHGLLRQKESFKL